MNYHAFPIRLVALFTFLLLAVALPKAPGAESNSPPSASRAEDANSQETLRSYLQLQEQLHATRLAIDQTRLENKEAAEQTAAALASHLKAIEDALAFQRVRELEAMQNSNHTMFLVGAAFVAIGFIAVLSMAYFQWRAVNRLAEISAALPALRAFGPGSALAALPSGDAPLVTVGPVEQSNVRLLGALERLEKRIFQLEHTAQSLAKGSTRVQNGTNTGPALAGGNSEAAASANGAASPPSAEPGAPAGNPQLTLLLAKGQSMLDLDQAETALACFNEILALDPNHAEALVKKGTALERLQKLADAIECYDRAIAADSSLTIAYLHKGGLFNRMERFNEALECYEQALRTQERRGV